MKKLYHHKTDYRSQLFSQVKPVSIHVASRLAIMGAIFLVAMVVISLRLFHLQIVHGSDMRARSDNNRIVVRRIPPARGVMYDRLGKAVVTNQPVQRLLINDQNIIQIESPILHREQVLQVEATQSGSLVTSIGRYYPYKESLAHVVGYVAEADKRELDSQDLIIGEMIGKSGLEKTINAELMGTQGSELIELDARGRVLRRVGERNPIPGKDVSLHIDADLQKFTYNLFDGRKGAAVVSNPQTGALYALVSSPSFDPNIFGYTLEELGMKQDTSEAPLSISQVLSSEDQLLLNRAISGAYPPGSVYKVVPSIAGLEEETVQADTEIDDQGVIEIDDYQFRNWYYTKYGRTDGLVNVITALKRSNDIYYYRLGEWLGINDLVKWSHLFGLGEKTEIDLPGEVSGLVPDPVWKERYKNERWYLGNTYHMSIGQGDLLTTPLQVHQMMGVIANQGRLCKPLLVKSIGTETLSNVSCSEVGISQDHLDTVIQGLVEACQSGGTAFPFFEFKLADFSDRFPEDAVVACKTGTAQFFDPEDRTHAWFSIFAPSKNPEIMITVLLEAAGEGSEQAAPLAKEVLEYWLQQ